jgi:esterase/lipase
MMVVTGANDPRVPQSEADQIVAAIRQKAARLGIYSARMKAMASRKRRILITNFGQQ